LTASFFWRRSRTAVPTTAGHDAPEPQVRAPVSNLSRDRAVNTPPQAALR